MVKISLSNLNLLRIEDNSTNATYYGCNQKWYNTYWQRLSGCGPSVACNIIHYIENKQDPYGKVHNSKENCITIMKEIWKYFTPKIGGISTTKMFYEDFLIYAKAKGLNVQYRVIDISKDKCSRPELSEVLYFLEEALEKDAPVAFLNLCNGAVKMLERWHWVTIVSLDKSEDGKRAFVDIIDGGEIKKIDLALWYSTTTLGGGFVYFTAFDGL
ncbi:MAG: hypothetical protein AB9844_04295 [Clostridiaceae bacterium]